MRIDKNTTIKLGDRNIVKIKIGDSIIWEKKTEPEIDYFYIESLGDGNTISVKNYGNGDTTNVTPTLEYSTDKNTWNTITFDWTSGTYTTELPVKLNTGGKMYFRNDTHLFSNNYTKYILFSPSVSSNVGGDIRTLSNYLDVNNETKTQRYMFYHLFYNNKNIVDASNLRLPYTTLESYCYNSMFNGCTSLVNAPSLPATTLADYCYMYMFYGCTSLVSAPELPATTLASSCYYRMFYGCTSLTTPHELPATTLASSCYGDMFYGCTSLTTAPTILPATTLANSCYNSMFSNCTSLVNAPSLPATTLAENCYQSMFYGCTSLVNAPSLPATTLAENCYQGMFNGCTSLVNAPSLPSTTLANSCYNSMFSNCTSLVSAPSLPATTLANSCYNSMFSNCTSLVSAPSLPATTLASSCYISMFYGCTSLVNAPSLPATTLANYCYNSMFYGCTSLTTAPTILPATTLANYCYQSMFYGCTSLTTPPELPSTTLAYSCYQSMFSNCTSLVSAPELPTTTLAEKCYSNMFKGCSKLNSITVYAEDISATGCTENWLSGVSSTGTFNNMSFTPFETDSTSGIPTGWTEVVPPIQSITANPDTFTIKSYRSSVTCKSMLTITTTSGRILTKTNSPTITVGENTGDTTRTIVETIPYKGSSYQVTIVQTANDVRPPMSWNVVSEGTYPFQLNSNGYYESTNKGKSNSYSYATLNYEGYDNLVLECINSSYANYDYGIISQPDVELSKSTSDDGVTGSTKVFKNFKGQSSNNPVQIVIPSDVESHFITIKYKKYDYGSYNNDSLQFRVIEP